VDTTKFDKTLENTSPGKGKAIFAKEGMERRLKVYRRRTRIVLEAIKGKAIVVKNESHGRNRVDEMGKEKTEGPPKQVG